MAEERRTPTAPQRRHDATLNLKRRITSPMRMPAIALDWRLLGWPAVYVIARWWLHLARPSCVVLHSAGVPAPPRPRAYARVAAVGGAAVCTPEPRKSRRIDRTLRTGRTQPGAGPQTWTQVH